MFWLAPLIAGAASAGVGALQGKAQSDEAARREKLNADLGALDTAYSPFVSAKSTKVAQTDPGMGMLGGGLGGALSGVQTGMNISNAYKDAQLKDAQLNGSLAVTPNQSINGYTESLLQQKRNPMLRNANFGQVSQELVG